MMPPRFQACIYWRKSVNWRHQLQPSIFSMVMSLFHGSTWSNPYVKDTVFISQHLLQSSKVRIYSKELIVMIYVWKVMCLMHESTCSHSPPDLQILEITLAPISRYWVKLRRGYFQFPDFWSISYTRKLS